MHGQNLDFGHFPGKFRCITTVNEQANTICGGVRANPFGPISRILGDGPELWHLQCIR